MKQFYLFLILTAMLSVSGVTKAQEERPPGTTLCIEKIVYDMPVVNAPLVIVNGNAIVQIVEPKTSVAQDNATTVTPVALHAKAPEFNSRYLCTKVPYFGGGYRDAVLKYSGRIDNPPDTRGNGNIGVKI